MIRSTCRLCISSWRVLAAGLVACTVFGCNAVDFRGEKFQYDPSLEIGPTGRPPIEESDFFGVSNKARQIERNVAR